MKWIDQMIVGLFDMYNTNDPYDIFDEMEIEVVKVEKV